MKYKIPYFLNTRQSGCERIAKAFNRGCGANSIQPYRQVNHLNAVDGVDLKGVFPRLKNVAVYGILRGCDNAMKEADEYWHIDHGYFGARNQYYRITRNAILHDGKGNHDWDKFNKFNIKFNNWKKDGRYIVICPPSVPMISFLEIHGWLDNTIKEIRKYTNREIVLSQKPNAAKGYYEKSLLANDLVNLPIKEALKDAWVLVTDQSNTMITALTQGVPIICTNKNRRIGKVEDIENPIYERDWLKNLAYNQWSIDEIRSGQAWRELNEWG